MNVAKQLISLCEVTQCPESVLHCHECKYMDFCIALHKAYIEAQKIESKERGFKNV